MSRASGRFRQYLFGISLRIAPRVEPRRVEDRGVIGEPRFRGVVGPGASPAARARSKRSCSIPVGARHVGVRIDQRMAAKRRTKNGAVRSTRCVRLEPGDDSAALDVLDLPEADEGLHLVDDRGGPLFSTSSRRRTSGSVAIANTLRLGGGGEAAV